MDTGQGDPVKSEKQTAPSEDGGSASDLSFTNGVARDYELKCALSKSRVRAVYPIYFSSLLPSQQVHARRVRTFLSYR